MRKLLPHASRDAATVAIQLPGFRALTEAMQIFFCFSGYGIKARFSLGFRVSGDVAVYG